MEQDRRSGSGSRASEPTTGGPATGGPATDGHWAAGPWGGGPWARGPWRHRSANREFLTVVSPRRRRRGPLRRAQEGRMIGGVASGLAARTGLRVNVVRGLFVVTAFMSGFGLVMYLVGWLFLPTTPGGPSIASRATKDVRGITLAAATASMLGLLLVLLTMLGVGWLSSFSVPLVIAAAGLPLIWRNAAPDEQALLRSLVEPLSAPGAGRRTFIKLRICLACVLLVGGLSTLLSGHAKLALLRPLSGILLLVAAVVVLLGPWWLRVARDLVTERQARARAEERADVAAVVHDSVLQTLALIQRRADNPQQVIALARAQERELRSWLFDGRAPGSMEGLATTVADGVRRIQQDVETTHGVTVEAITVGDCELDDDLRALLAAAREATVNAAKWSGAPVVSLFTEVEPGEVAVFVRDRGRGFDPETVPADRKGLAESIRARMTRRGGSVTIRSVLGEGTEVSLSMKRPAHPHDVPVGQS